MGKKTFERENWEEYFQATVLVKHILISERIGEESFQAGELVINTFKRENWGKYFQAGELGKNTFKLENCGNALL